MDAHARKQEETVVADDAPYVVGTGIGGPSDPFVPRPQLPGRRAEADAAEHAVALRTDPVADLAAGGPGPSQRMVRPHHRLPEPAVVGVAHRIERDGAEFIQRAGQFGAGDVPGRDLGGNGRVGHGARRRKLQSQAVGKLRQRPGRRGQARTAAGVSPARALAQPAGQRMAGGATGTKGTGEPDERLRIEMAETDLHARSMHKTDCLYESDQLKGPGATHPASVAINLQTAYVPDAAMSF